MWRQNGAREVLVDCKQFAVIYAVKHPLWLDIVSAVEVKSDDTSREISLLLTV